MTVPGDRYSEWDAAYVLGALSPAERLEFEDHLSGCGDCQAAVAQLAGMPGLLAQVPITDLPRVPDGDISALPDIPSMPAAPPRQAGSSRRRAALAGAALAASFLLGALGGYLAGGPLGPGSDTTVDGPIRVAFSPVQPSSLTAVVDVVPQGDSTVLQVECQYGWAGASDGTVAGEYAIVVVTEDGRSTAVKTWTVRPNRVMRPSGTAQLAPRDIEAVEIRRVSSGETLLRAPIT
jgi:hypothetical protein